MKQRLLLTWLTLAFTILLVVACGTAPPAEPTSTPSGNLSEPDGNPALETAATAPSPPTAESLPETYPPPQPAVPLPPTREPGYPPPPTFPP